MINLNARDRSGSSGFMEAAWIPDIVDLARESFGDAMSLKAGHLVSFALDIFSRLLQTKRTPKRKGYQTFGSIL